MSENNLTGYEKRYNAVYNYLDTHKALKNILLLLYKVLPYVTALSYMVLIVLCARSKSTIATPAIALSVDATGYVETSNVFITAKLILAPLTSFIFISFIRKCLDSPRPYTKYNITPIVKKDKEGESMPSRHIFSITIIAMCWLYIYQPVGIILLVRTLVLAVLRVVMGVHFIKDVIAGIICGIICGFIGLWIL